MGLSQQLLRLGGRVRNALMVFEHRAPEVDLGTLLFDFDERELTGAVLNGDGGMTTWPDATGNTAGAVDVEGGAFAVGSDHGHSTVIAHFDDSGDEGGDGSGPRPVVDIDLTDPHTLYYLVTLGDDAPDDTEMIARSLDPASNVWYQDTYTVADDRPTSRVLGYTFGEFHGGPQIGDTYVVTCVNDPIEALIHVDGIEANGSDQTIYGSSGIGDLPSPTGIMLANYPGGGYCLPGRHRRWLCYDGVHNAAQRSAVRDLLIAQAAEDEITITKYPETPLPPGRVISGTVTDGVDPIEGAAVMVVTLTHGRSGDAVFTDIAGHYSATTRGLEDGEDAVVLACPPGRSLTPGYAPDALTASDATVLTLDQDHAGVDIELSDRSLDPLADPDLLDHWDARDLESLTLDIDGKVSSFANQLSGRPAMVPIDITHFTADAELGGAPALGSIADRSIGHTEHGLIIDASDYTGPITIIAVASSPDPFTTLIARPDPLFEVFDPQNGAGWVGYSSAGVVVFAPGGDTGFAAMGVGLGDAGLCTGAEWTARGSQSAATLAASDSLDFGSPAQMVLSSGLEGAIQQVLVIARLVPANELLRMCQTIGPLFGDT